MQNAYRTSAVSYPHRFIALAAWTGAALACISVFVGLRAVDFDIDAIGNPLGLVGIGVAGADALETSMICDMFGYYLAAIPLILYLWFWLRDEHPYLITLGTVLGLLYSVTGLLGTGILSVLWPSTIIDYQHAASDPVAAQVAAALYKNVTQMVYFGMWGRAEYLMSGVALVCVGMAAWRRKRSFAIASLVAGLSALAASGGELSHAHGVADLGLNLYLVTAAVWQVWGGVLAWRRVTDHTPGSAQA